MAKVMMRCPLPAQTAAQNGNPEFFTGIEIEAGVSLANLGTKVVACPICNGYHYVRAPYLEGGEQGLQHFEGLEAAPPFAIEVGVIISTVAFAEAYIPQIYCKFTGMSTSHAIQVFGSISSVGQKIRVLENYSDFLKDEVRQLRASPLAVPATLQPKDKAQKDLASLCSKLRTCMTLRDHYAHAKYNAGGYPTCISMLPFFGDFGKRKEPIDLTLEVLQRDSAKILAIKMEIRDHILNG